MAISSCISQTLPCLITCSCSKMHLLAFSEGPQLPGRRGNQEVHVINPRCPYSFTLGAQRAKAMFCLILSKCWRGLNNYHYHGYIAASNILQDDNGIDLGLEISTNIYSMHIHVCVYMYVCVYVYVYVYVHVYVYVCVYVYVYVCMHVRMYVCMHACMYTYMYTYVYV